MARSTPLKWIQEQGGWTTAKLLLDTYGHFMPSETQGFADALSAAPNGPLGRPQSFKRSKALSATASKPLMNQ